MLEQSRVAFLYRKLVEPKNIDDDEIDQLNLEEMTYIYAASEMAKKDEKFKEHNLPIRQQVFYWRIVRLIKEAENLYVAHVSGMLYPYIDPARMAWIFSTEEIARRTTDEMKTRQKISLTIRRVDQSMLPSLFAQLYFCGVKGVIVDNGAHPVRVQLSDLDETPAGNDGQNQQTFANGDLQALMIQFSQYLRTPELENREKVLSSIHLSLMFQIMNASYLMPMRLKKDGVIIRPGVKPTDMAGIESESPFVRDKDGVDWLPVFTDWPEFSRAFKPSEWGAAVLDYTKLMEHAAKLGRQIVINPRGCGFRMTDKVIEQLHRFEPLKDKIARAATDKTAAEELAQELRAMGGQAAAGAGMGGKGMEGQPAPAREDRQELRSVKEDAQPENPAPSEAIAGVYTPVEEYPDLLCSVLKKTARASRLVRRMWLLERTADVKNLAYLCVIEPLSADDDLKALESELKEQAEEYLDGHSLECRLLNEELQESVADMKPFYKKGIFGF